MPHKPNNFSFFRALRFILPYGIAVLLGLLLGIYLPNWNVVQFEKKLSFGEALSSLVSICVALVVGLVVDKRMQDTRGEKDLLLRRTEALLNPLRELEEKVVGAAYSYTAAASGIKRMRLSLSSLKQCLDEHGYKAGVDDCVTADKLLDNLRDQMTGDFEANKSTRGSHKKAKVQNGAVSVDHNIRSAVEGSCSRIRDTLHDLLMAINSR